MLKFVILFLCFQVGFPEAPLKDRLDIAVRAKKPILTIFSAPWCQPCQVMKNVVIEPLRASGQLDSVSTIYVDVDKEKDFTKKHIGENFIIPTILLFFNENGKWLKYELNGYRSQEEILRVIELPRLRNQK